MNPRLLWISGSGAAVAAAVTAWLATAGAASGDFIVRWKNAPQTLSAGGETEMLALVNTHLPAITDDKIKAVTLHPGTEPDGNGGQNRTVHLRAYEEDCGTAAQAAARSLAANEYQKVSESEGTVCWRAGFVTPKLNAQGITDTEELATGQLGLSDAASMSTIECVANGADFDCTLYEVKTRTPAQYATDGDSILEFIDIVP